MSLLEDVSLGEAPLLELGEAPAAAPPSQKSASCSDWPDFSLLEGPREAPSASAARFARSLSQPESEAASFAVPDTDDLVFHSNTPIAVADSFQPFQAAKAATAIAKTPKQSWSQSDAFPEEAVVEESPSTSLNGFIKHQSFPSDSPPPSHGAAGPAAPKLSMPPAPPKKQKGTRDPVIVDLGSSSGSSSDEESDLFSSARFGADTQSVSLLKGSARNGKRKTEDLVLRRASDPGAARVLGASKRARMRCCALVLVSNIGLAVAIAVIVALDRGWRPLSAGSSKPLVLRKDSCPFLNASYIANLTSERKGIYAVGHLRLIGARGRKRILLLPYGSYCSPSSRGTDCPPGGVLALDAASLDRVWEHRLKGPGDLKWLTCGADVDGDGVEDCSVVAGDPWEVALLSGSSGRVLLGWDDEGDEGWSVAPPLPLADLNDDGRHDLLLVFTKRRLTGTTDSLFRVWESVANSQGDVAFELAESDAPGARQEKLVIQNATIRPPVLKWTDGDGAERIGWRVAGQPGFLSLSTSAFLFARYGERVVSGAERAGILGPGFLADLDEDGRVEWVGCSSSRGTLVALSLVAGAANPRWSFALPDHACLPDTLAFGRDGRGDVQVAAYFARRDPPLQSEMVVLRGDDGKKVWQRRVEDGGVDPSFAPLSLRVEDPSTETGDWLVVWNQTERRLDLVGRPFHFSGHDAQPSHLYKQAAYSLKAMASEEERRIAALLNQRFTGTFFVDSAGTAETFFVHNVFDEEGRREWRLLVHRINMRCGCHKPPCGRFAPFQPWSAFRGSQGTAIYMHP